MNVFTAMNELLKRPDDALSRATERPPSRSVALLAGAIGCYVLYGAAAGLFQGGSTVAIAVLKVPLIIVGTLVLCVPSFYIFTALAGIDYTPRTFATAIAGFCGVAGLILLALMPIVWLFSVSTISLGFVVWLHVLTWMAALVFARQFLIRSARSASAAIGLWLVLVFLVSLQMTTYVRPVLWRSAGEPIFAREKMSFFTHLHDVGSWKP